MARKTPLPQAELAICRRLKLYRQRCDLPRRLFARELGLDASVIIRIELGRAPLRYGVACKITRVFGINPGWLASGSGPITASVLLPSPDEISVDERELFTSVFNHKLLESLRQKVAKLESSPSHKYGTSKHPTDPKGRVDAEEFLRMDIREWITCVPDARFNELVNAIRYAAMPIVYDWDPNDDPPEVIAERRAAMDIDRASLKDRRAVMAARMRLAAERRKNPGAEKKVLTSVDGSVKLLTVNSQLKNLLARLISATNDPGRKTELADFLGAPLASVSRWLSGKREPGGEITLRMLAWVAAIEGQQPKSPGGALTPPEPKTQVSSSGYEKQTQVRKKR
jgi:transcriptional regulator with XRE-family HTH domain